MHPIETRDLSVVYRGHLFVKPTVGLDGLSLTVREGEVFGFIGANGAGKTTTIKTLLGLIRPTRGESRLFGKNSREPAARRDVGFLPEAPYFYEYLSARETLSFYASLSGVPDDQIATRAGEVLERVGLSHAADRAVKTYSRGMRQRLGIGQAIVHEPKLAILDEPMSGLDPIGRRDVRMLILDLARKGITVFFSSHILSDIEALCDQVGVVSGGKLVASGPVKDLATPRVKAVEVRCKGVSPETLAPNVPAGLEIRDDAGVLTFEVPDGETANRAAKVIIDGGGALESLVPAKESLEEVFDRLRLGSADSGDGDGAKDEAAS